MEDDELPTAKDMFFKTKLCKFFAAGRCDRGRRCSFAHGDTRLANLPDFYRTRLCTSYLRKGTCAIGNSCCYAHSKSELRSGVTKSTANAANVPEVMTAGREQPKVPGFVPNMSVDLPELQRQLLATMAQQRDEGVVTDPVLVQSRAVQLLEQNLAACMMSERREHPAVSSSASGLQSDLEVVLAGLAEQASRSSRSHLQSRQIQQQQMQGANIQLHASQQLDPRNLDLEQLEFLANVGAQHLAGLGIDLQNGALLEQSRKPAIVQQLTQQPSLPHNTDGMAPSKSLPAGLIPPRQGPQQVSEFGPQVGALLELRRQLLHLSQQEAQVKQQASTSSRSHGSAAFEAPRVKPRSGMENRQAGTTSPVEWDSSDIPSEALRQRANFSKDSHLEPAAKRQDGLTGCMQPTNSFDYSGVDGLIQSLQAVSQREGFKAPTAEQSSSSSLTHSQSRLSKFEVVAAPSESTHSSGPEVGASRADKLPASQVEWGRTSQLSKTEGRPMRLTVKNTFLDVDNVDKSEAAFRTASATAPELPLIFLDGDNDVEI